MYCKDSVSLQKAFSDATLLLSNLRTHLAQNTLDLSNSNSDIDKIQPFNIVSFKQFHEQTTYNTVK